MKNSNILESNLKPEYFSGSIRFSTDYISKAQLVEACSKIVSESPEFLQLRVRTGGGNDLAVDLLLDSSEIPQEETKGACVNYLKKLFKKHLGDDYLRSYDLGNMTVIVK